MGSVWFRAQSPSYRLVVQRVVQGLGAQVAPVPVEPQRGVGRACAGDFEQLAAQLQALAAGGDLGGGDGGRQFAAFLGAQFRPLGPGAVEPCGGAFDE